MMRSDTRRSYRPHLAVPLAAGLIVLAVSACSSGSSNPSVANVGSSAPSASQSPGGAQPGSGGQGGSQLGSGGLTVAFSECMRSHGEPKFPDPNSQGVVGSLIQLGIDPNSPQFQAAEKACASLANGPEPSGQSQSQNKTAALKYSTCMRSHGFPNFPDPNANGAITGNSSDGINTGSPQYQSAQKTCSQQTGYGKGASESNGS